jgi:F0F1-type ATP synthase membrane subunit b/b'
LERELGNGDWGIVIWVCGSFLLLYFFTWILLHFDKRKFLSARSQKINTPYLSAGIMLKMHL